MNVFSRTFLPAAVDAGLSINTVSRHLPVLRQCVGRDDPVALLARCAAAGRGRRGEFLLLLTYRRMVVTRSSWPWHRLHLHLNSDLRHLDHVTWTTDPRAGTVDLAATAVDGVRERFTIRAAHPKQVWQLDTVFGHVFRPRSTTLAVAQAAAAPRESTLRVARPSAPTRAARLSAPMHAPA